MSNTAPTATNNVTRIDPGKPRQEHLLQNAPTLDETSSLDLKPVYISLELDPSAFRTEIGGFADSAQSPYAIPKGAFDTALRGTGKYTDRIWFFKGDSYIRYYPKANGKDETEGPLPISPHWSGWPASFATGIDAALQGTGMYEGLAWFFKGSQYLRYDLTNDKADGSPKPIAGNWRGVPDTFAQKIDAAIHGVGNYYEICWLFSGNQYQRYNLKTDTAEGAPTPILGNWGGQSWPMAFADGIDGAFYGTGPNAEKIYFFRGDKYLLYNLKTNHVDDGPKPILENFRALARFMPQPQLFIVEQHVLRTFRGQAKRGERVDTIYVPERTKVEKWIVTKKSEIITQQVSTNVLESQTQQAADSFSRAVKSEQSKTVNEEKYNYQMDASMHGEAEMSLKGGEVDARVQVQGATNDVNKNYASGVQKQLQNQASETNQTHKQQVSVRNAVSEINEETETGYKQIIDNTANPNPLNNSLFQIVQQYIVVLSLVDVQLAFYNGDPREAMLKPIGDMASLLDKCILQQADSDMIKNVVIDVFKEIPDHTGQKRRLIVQDPDNPERYQVDRMLHSTYEYKDSAGGLIQKLEVQGIILSVSDVNVLTTNVLLGPSELRPEKI